MRLRIRVTVNYDPSDDAALFVYLGYPVFIARVHPVIVGSFVCIGFSAYRMRKRKILSILFLYRMKDSCYSSGLF